MALGQHLRADQDVDVAGVHLLANRRERALATRAVAVDRGRCAPPETARRARAPSRCVPWPSGSRSTLPHSGQARGSRSRWPQWWQRSSPASRCTTSRALQRGQPACQPQAAHSSDGEIAAAVDEHQRLLAAREPRLDRGERAARPCRRGRPRRGPAPARAPAAGRRRPRAAAAAAACSGRAARAAASPATASRCPARPARARWRARQIGDVAAVVADDVLLLVRRVVLLVDDDQARAAAAARRRRGACRARGRRRRWPPRASGGGARRRRARCAASPSAGRAARRATRRSSCGVRLISGTSSSTCAPAGDRPRPPRRGRRRSCRCR